MRFITNFKVWTTQIFIIPTIEVVIDNMMYSGHNVAICFHWLCFHARLFWIDEDGGYRG